MNKHTNKYFLNYKIKVIILLLTCFSFLSLFNKNEFSFDENKILWSKKKLKWNYFQGTPNHNIDYKAITTSNISVQSDIKSKVIYFKVECYFIKNLSWTKDTTSIVLLKHENLHFDISELITRKIRREYSRYVSRNINETPKDLDKIYKYYVDIHLDSVQKVYDKETQHGVLLDKQKIWETKIEKEIKKMDGFKSNIVIIKRIN